MILGDKFLIKFSEFMKNKIYKYGKSSASIMQIKGFYIDENDALKKEDDVINEIYKSQPKRETCKNCTVSIGSIDFVKQGISYSICVECGHLNGLYADTDKFCEMIYTSDDVNYLKNYSANDMASFKERVQKVYAPKADFLFESLSNLGESPERLSYADIGAGLGFFVSALRNKGCESVTGWDVSEENVKIANTMIGEDLVKYHSLSLHRNLKWPVEADVVSMIGVLEHMQNPREIVKALVSRAQTKYIFVSVPLFSPAVFFEMVFPEVMQRVLSRDHTHLYTNESLDWLANDCGLERVSEWWFGLDMVDLFRDVAVMLSKSTNNSAKVINVWEEMFQPLIDAMQLEIDKKHLSSEVHILFKKKV
jgi:2-polyprenyl-3-methyl-5-hydroxy-6-metoxy-1,4-benzoquinol methylase